MSIYVDKKYINLVSSSLDKFKWKSESIANCRCAICGDSSKSKIKARGYFYSKGNDFFYKCHNCNFSTNLYNFTKYVKTGNRISTADVSEYAKLQIKGTTAIENLLIYDYFTDSYAPLNDLFIR